MYSACLVKRSPWAGGNCVVVVLLVAVETALAPDAVDCNASFCVSSSNEAFDDDDEADANDTVDDDTPFVEFETLTEEYVGMLFVVVRNFRGSITC